VANRRLVGDKGNRRLTLEEKFIVKAYALQFALDDLVEIAGEMFDQRDQQVRIQRTGAEREAEPRRVRSAKRKARV
jgi:hypothetical protein